MFKGHLIRRYGNRKLYSITESRYITLPEIAEKFLDGSGFIIRDLKNIEGPKQGKQGSRHRTAIFDEVQLALYARAWEYANPNDRVVGVGISEVGEETHHYVEVDDSILKYLADISIGVVTNYTANHFHTQQDGGDSYTSRFRAWIEERIQTSARAISSAEEGNFHPTPCKQCYYCLSLIHI